MRDRPPFLAFLLLFMAMLAVVIGLVAVNEALTQAEQAPSGARPESQTQPFQPKQQEKTT